MCGVVVPENLLVCLVFLFDRSLSKLPSFAFKEDVLYCGPKAATPADDYVPWYEAVALGKISLAVL